MALGGGTFTTQNKKLPGSYINFISLATANATLSDRGYIAFPLKMKWGAEDKIIEVSKEDFCKNSKEIFGYSYDSDELKLVRELFTNAQMLYTYRLNSGGVKASNSISTAVYSGEVGNSITTAVTRNVDDSTKFDVKTYFEGKLYDTQTVENVKELVPNIYVTFENASTLTESAGEKLAGGTDGTVDGAAHQKFLDLIESYAFNAIGTNSTDTTTKALYAAFTKRMRDDNGVKFQCVLYDYAKADYEGVVSVTNKVTTDGFEESDLVHYVTSLIGGCAVNKSNLNHAYSGELDIDTSYTQTELANFIDAGKFTFHKVGNEIKVLSDCNTLMTTTVDKGDIFKDNKTIRVIDQIATDIAYIFNEKYLGVIPNDDSGRTALWNDVVKIHKELSDIAAIEEVADDDIVISQGNTNKSVLISDKITIIGTMAQLYMNVTVQ